MVNLHEKVLRLRSNNYFRLFCIVISIALFCSIATLPAYCQVDSNIILLKGGVFVQTIRPRLSNPPKGKITTKDESKIKLNPHAKSFISVTQDDEMEAKVVYFNIFCYILSMSHYVCMCTSLPAIRSMHGSHELSDKNDTYHALRGIRVSNVDRLLIGQLNINSLGNKFEALKLIVKGNLDIFIVTESKLDDTFPVNQFIIDGFSPPFRADRNKNGGAVIIYVISSKLILRNQNG